MKETARKTRSATCNGKAQRAEILIKREEQKTKFIDTSPNQRESLATSLVVLNVKVEEKEANLKSQLSRRGNGKGLQ